MKVQEAFAKMTNKEMIEHIEAAGWAVSVEDDVFVARDKADERRPVVASADTVGSLFADMLIEGMLADKE